MVFNGHGNVNHSENFVNPPREEPPIWMPAGRFNNECLDWNWKRNPPAAGLQPFRIHTQHIEIERAWRDLKSHIKSSSSLDFASQYLDKH
ncbi:hypothetical protein NQ318_004687 [Aromia moschata]|uniref:Transposase n=1 Tax=Aromia moschata TaxID=1265417 RepID=A0AAV8X5T1_9CUCU|nr:hypothetical protein NQ318_004687 [Aromia moschata]